LGLTDPGEKKHGEIRKIIWGEKALRIRKGDIKEGTYSDGQEVRCQCDRIQQKKTKKLTQGARTWITVLGRSQKTNDPSNCNVAKNIVEQSGEYSRKLERPAQNGVGERLQKKKRGPMKSNLGGRGKRGQCSKRKKATPPREQPAGIKKNPSMRRILTRCAER